MAKKNFLVDLDLNKQQILNGRVQNLTTAQRTTLAGTLVAADTGLFVYDTTLLKLFVWNGTAFTDVTPAPPQIGQYRGGVLHTDPQPANLVSGDWVVFTSAGFATNFDSSQTVQIGDWAMYNGTTWDILQGNVDVATETAVGLVRLADEDDVDNESNTTAISPFRLKNLLSSKKRNEILVLAANVPVIFGVDGDVEDITFQQEIGGKLQLVELEWVYDTNFSRLEITSNVAVNVRALITFV